MNEIIIAIVIVTKYLYSATGGLPTGASVITDKEGNFRHQWKRSTDRVKRLVLRYGGRWFKLEGPTVAKLLDRALEAGVRGITKWSEPKIEGKNN